MRWYTFMQWNLDDMLYPLLASRWLRKFRLCVYVGGCDAALSIANGNPDYGLFFVVFCNSYATSIIGFFWFGCIQSCWVSFCSLDYNRIHGSYQEQTKCTRAHPSGFALFILQFHHRLTNFFFFGIIVGDSCISS